MASRSSKTDIKVNEIRTVSRSELRMAPCQEACPARVDVPRYIRYIRKGLFEEALAVNRERIPLPYVCGYACFNPCEKRCAMNQFGEPVAIRMLKRASAEIGDNNIWKSRKKKAPPTGKKVAIVGAGPAGLTAAYYLATVGHEVTVFDANEHPGGTMRYGIPRYRLPLQALDRDIRDILETGVRFEPSIRLGEDITLESLKEEYDAVVVAVGTTLSRKINLEGISLRGVMWGLEFLQDISMGKEIKVEKELIVVGGGNVAIDVALSARRLGAEHVDLVCLERREEMPAHEWEIARAEEEGVKIHNSWGPVRVIGENGKVKGVEFKRCTRVFNSDGLFDPRFDEETRIIMDTKQVIFAIGQITDPYIKSITDPDFHKFTTKIKGVFATGDFIKGPTSIIEAIAQGRAVAVEVDRYLGGSGDISEILAKEETEVQISDERKILRYRESISLLPIEERLRSFEPVELGYSKELAKREAERCLNCDARFFEVTVFTDNCKACGYCAEVCKMGVFDVSAEFNKRGVRPMKVQKSERCVGCLQCFYVCPDFAIEIEEVRFQEEEL